MDFFLFVVIRMLNLIRREVFLLMTLALTCEVFASDYIEGPEIESHGEESLAEIIPYVENDKVISQYTLAISTYLQCSATFVF